MFLKSKQTKLFYSKAQYYSTKKMNYLEISKSFCKEFTSSIIHCIWSDNSIFISLKKDKSFTNR